MADEIVKRRVRILNTTGKGIETKCLLDDGSQIDMVTKVEISPIEVDGLIEAKITVVGAEVDVVADEFVKENQ